jgi:hypothetical protein
LGEDTESFAFKLDRVKPVIAVSGGMEGWRQSATLTVSLETSPDSGAVCYYSADDGLNWNAMTSGSVEVRGHFDGEYLFKAVSGSGVESDEVSARVRVSDAQPTAPQITTTGNVAGWTNQTVTLSAGASTVAGFGAGEGVAYYQVEVGGGGWQAYNENEVITIDTNTNAVYRFRAVSVSGVEGAESSVEVRFWSTINAPSALVEAHISGNTGIRRSPRRP